MCGSMLMLMGFVAPEPRSKKDRTLKTEIEPLVRLEGDAG
jgi:hypothetical protein